MRICEFFAGGYDPRMLEYHKAENPYVPRGKDGRPKESHLDVLVPVHSRDVSAWKSLLTMARGGDTEKDFLKAMVQRGYQPIASGKG